MTGAETPETTAKVAESAAPLAGLEGARPNVDRIERDRVLAAVQERLLGKKTTMRIGRFEISERVGAGAMGAVYRGRDTELGRHVALKLLHQAVDGSTGQQSRIVREAKALAQVHHSNVVTVFDIGTHDDRTFVAMEMVEGSTLTEWLAQEERSWQDVVKVMTGAARGLQAVHRQGLVHRDLKPDNILIDPDGVPRIADFGLVKPASDEHGHLGYNPDDPSHDVALTATGALMGTPAYMAPEQLQKGEADARSDQYAFGATFFEALFGRRPHEAATIGELVALTSEGRLPTMPGATPVPKRVYAVVRRALATNADDRFPDMTSLLSELDAAMPEERSGWGWRLATAGLAIVVITGGYWVSQRQEPAPVTVSAPAPTAAEHVIAIPVVPPHAKVSVDGTASPLTDGRLSLTGPAGASFLVELEMGELVARHTVVITRDGKAAPATLSLEVPPESPSNARPTAAPANDLPTPRRFQPGSNARPNTTAAPRASATDTPSPNPTADPGIGPMEDW